MQYFYPPGFFIGKTPGTVNTSYYQYANADVVPGFSGKLGIINWYNCLQNTDFADLNHLIKSVDHVVIVSSEEFWPTLTSSRANAQSILDLLKDYSIIYHCDSHERINNLGVHSTWQPWFPRMPVTDYDYLPGDRDYDFACLLGRQKTIRDQIADVLCEHNSLVNYIGRDGTVLDHDLSHYHTQNEGNTPVEYNDQYSSWYQSGDLLDAACLPPVDVYAQSHMDIISETFPRNQYSNNVLITEKTAKSLAHGRLFRTLGHKGYLGELIRCGFEPLPIWRSDHDTGTQDDCWNSFVADLNEYSGNDFDMLYDECARELQHNKQVHEYIVKNYPNRIHQHFEALK